jgi:hypothetical protein
VIRKTVGLLALVGVACAVGCGEAFVAGPSDASSDAPLHGDGGGDASVDAPADSATDTSAMDVGLDGPSDVDAGPPWSPVCPTDQPKVGADCSPTGAVCEYPTAKLPLQYDISCDVVLECTAGAWTRDTDFNSSTCQLDLPNSSSCPNTYDALIASPGGTCSVDNLRCEYPDHVCVCARSLGGPVELIDAGETWSCNPGTGCPMPRPRLGATCATNNQACTYQSCDFEETCLNGYWNGEEAACATANSP